MEIQPQLVMYNTLTKRQELFRPRTPGKVKFFSCGPSVYRRQHLGNYRTYIFEDILQKYLEYLGYTVERGINFTDLEDKSIDQAGREGISVSEVTERHIAEFLKNAGELGIYLPGYIPKSTDSVDTAAEIIQTLLDKGNAYRYEGNIYFDPLTHDGFGEIFGLDMSRWPKKKVRFSRDTYNGQRWNLGDFILWHGGGQNGPVWDTSFGKGRPAWNIQDPAMIKKKLGTELDIHAGGIDNIYRHHDYTRAVLESYSGKPLAAYWYHCRHLIVDGQKMSKSKGNTLYPEDAYAWGCSPKKVRFMLMSIHYQEELNITQSSIENCCDRIGTLQEDTAFLAHPGGGTGHANAASDRAQSLIEELPVLFRAKMNDNLNVPGAVQSIGPVLGELRSLREKYGFPEQVSEALNAEIKKIDLVLGILHP